MDPSVRLTRVSDQQQVSLYVPSSIENTASSQKSLSASVQELYSFCQTQNHSIVGIQFMTFDRDLSQRNIEVLTSSGDSRRVTRIKTTSFVINQRCASLKWEIEIEGETKTFITSREAPSLPDHMLNGNEFERSFFDENSFAVVPKEVWDNWETLMSYEIQHYTKVIHPQINETLRKICTLHPHLKMHILDIGGGDGVLGERIIQALPDQVAKVHVLDGSQKLIETAKHRAEALSGKLIAQVSDIQDMIDTPSVLSEYDGHVDIVILCGVVAQQVLNKQTALNLVRKCHSILPENGFLVAASLSPALINSQEYEAIGYEVLNKTITNKIHRNPNLPSYATNDFYTLQKIRKQD